MSKFFFSIFQHYLGATIEYDLLESLHKHLNDAQESNCGAVKHIFVKQIQKYVNSTWPADR